MKEKTNKAKRCGRSTIDEEIDRSKKTKKAMQMAEDSRCDTHPTDLAAIFVRSLFPAQKEETKKKRMRPTIGPIRKWKLNRNEKAIDSVICSLWTEIDDRTSIISPPIDRDAFVESTDKKS
jgi:hypothetical protein